MRYETASLLLAGLATPTGALCPYRHQLRFRSVATLPGWHTTIFPPYFVAGAVYSGFAMVITLAVPIRKFYHLEDMITTRHLDNMAKVMLTTGLIVAYGYAHGIIHGLVLGQPLGIFRVLEPYVRADGLVLLGADYL